MSRRRPSDRDLLDRQPGRFAVPSPPILTRQTQRVPARVLDGDVIDSLVESGRSRVPRFAACSARGSWCRPAPWSETARALRTLVVERGASIDWAVVEPPVVEADAWVGEDHDEDRDDVV